MHVPNQIEDLESEIKNLIWITWFFYFFYLTTFCLEKNEFELYI